jgi:hypothetical protein
VNFGASSSNRTLRTAEWIPSAPITMSALSCSPEFSVTRGDALSGSQERTVAPRRSAPGASR